MTTTIFLADPLTLRVSFPYSKESVAAIKTIGGARWHPESKTWRLPLERLDALLGIFGDSAAIAPEVVLAADAELREFEAPRPATPEQRIVWFAETCAWAGVTLQIAGAHVIGSGGCWTPVLQAAIDSRADQLRRLLESGWQAPRSAAAPAPAPVPANLDLITHMDRVLAAGEQNARKNAEREAGYKEAAKRKRFETMRQESLLEGEPQQ